MMSPIRPARSGRVVVLAAALGALLSLYAGSAQAQLSPQQKNEMKLHYDKATRAYDVGKYPEAIEEYQKAYEIGGDAAMIYNIAQAYRLSDQLSEAIRFYRRYLQRSPAAPNREIVERRIAELEKVVEERKKSGTTYATPVPPPAPTPQPVPYNPPIPQPPPPVAAPPPIATSPPSPPPPFEPTPAPRVSRGRLYGGLLVMAGGALLGGAAVWQGKIAQEKADKLSSQSQQMASVAFNPAVETNGKNANTFAILLGSFSGIALVAGGILALTAPSYSTSSPPPAESRPPGTTIAPVIGVGYMGASAGWSF
jgi:tetratricopeptide (TPR) repeat protein